MSKLKYVLLCALIVSVLPASVAATGVAPVQDATSLTLTIEPQLIRFSTPAADVAEWRLQIGDAQGQQIYDSGAMSSSALTWTLVDSQGQAIDSGIYSYSLSVRGAGRGRSRHGQLLVQKTANGYQVWAMTDSQAALSGDGETMLTVTASAGSPTDPIAPAAPELAPTSSAALPTSLGRTSFGAVTGYISGTGTTNVMTKWFDGPGGVVGDTAVSEYAGAVTIGNGTYYGNLQIFGGAANDLFAGMGPNIATGPAFNFGYAGASFGRSAGFFNVRPDASASAPNPSLRFMTANVERMIVTNAGAVGINETTPVARLEVVTDSTPEQGVTVTHYNDVQYPGLFIGQSARGTKASPSPVLSGDRLAAFNARGYTPSGFPTASSASVEVAATENWTDTAWGSVMTFGTTPNGSNTRVERIRINQDGNVGIGTSAALVEKLHVFGDIRVGNAGTNGCLQRFDGTTIAGACASDVRFKRDITPFPNMLEQVATLRPVHYFWRSDEFPKRGFGATQSYGLIAQEVEQVFPDLVSEDAQGYKQVNYSKLPLLTLQAVKELKTENDALKLQLQQLHERLQRLEAAATSGPKKDQN